MVFRSVSTENPLQDELQARSNLCENTSYHKWRVGASQRYRDNPFLFRDTDLYLHDLYRIYLKCLGSHKHGTFLLYSFCAVCGHILFGGFSFWRWGVRQEEHSCAFRSQMEIVEHVKQSKKYFDLCTEQTISRSYQIERTLFCMKSIPSLSTGLLVWTNFSWKH